MKKFMKIAAMMVAAIALCVSCEALDNNGQDGTNDGNENVDGGNTGNENEGEQGGDVTEPISIEGKQFTYVWDMGALGTVSCCLDFGKTESGKWIFAQDMYGELTLDDWKMMLEGMFETDAELNEFAQTCYDSFNGKYSIYMEAEYELIPTDDASGQINITMGEDSLVIEYSGFDGEKCVFNCPSLDMNNVEAAVSAETIAITAEDPFSALM